MPALGVDGMEELMDLLDGEEEFDGYDGGRGCRSDGEVALLLRRRRDSQLCGR